MFKRLKLWFWKWFRPSKYNYYIGYCGLYGLLAGFSTASVESKKAAKNMEKLARAMDKLAVEE